MRQLRSRYFFNWARRLYSCRIVRLKPTGWVDWTYSRWCVKRVLSILLRPPQPSLPRLVPVCYLCLNVHSWVLRVLLAPHDVDFAGIQAQYLMVIIQSSDEGATRPATLVALTGESPVRVGTRIEKTTGFWLLCERQHRGGSPSLVCIFVRRVIFIFFVTVHARRELL